MAEKLHFSAPGLRGVSASLCLTCSMCYNAEREHVNAGKIHQWNLPPDPWRRNLDGSLICIWRSIYWKYSLQKATKLVQWDERRLVSIIKSARYTSTHSPRVVMRRLKLCRFTSYILPLLELGKCLAWLLANQSDYLISQMQLNAMVQS